MAIYHLNAKTVSRSSGGSAANALAYETGSSLNRIDGQTIDFSKKGVEQSAIIGTGDDLQTLADRMELAENRRNSTVARRMTIALPDELSKEERWECAEKFAQWIHDEYQLAVVVSMHAPDQGGDQRNHHAHLTMSDRKVAKDGSFGEKARELTCMSKKEGIEGEPRAKHHLKKMREKWAGVCNEALERSGEDERIDHRSYQERGIEKKPTKHLGKCKTEIIRKSRYTVTDELTNEHIEQVNSSSAGEEKKPEKSRVKSVRIFSMEEIAAIPREEKRRMVFGDDVVEPEENENEQTRGILDEKTERDGENFRHRELPKGGSESYVESLQGRDRDGTERREGSGKESEGGREGSGQSERGEGKSEGNGRHREGEGRDRIKRIESLLREVKSRAGGLAQRNEQYQRRVEGRGDTYATENRWRTLKKGIGEPMDEHKQKILNVFAKRAPEEVKKLLKVSHLKGLFQGFQEKFKEIVQKAKERERDDGYER